MGQEDAPEDQASWSTPGAHGTDGIRKRGAASSAKKEKPMQNHSAKDDSDAIKNIRQCKNYYEILGVAQDCSEDDLKKAYKKLALKYHPDKNHTPGATEAFKAISNAFSVLNDPAKRSRYDQYGTEEEQALTRGRHSYEDYDYTRGFEGDISAEELFNMFFGSGFQMGGPGVRTYYTRPRTQYRYHRHYQQPYTAAPDDEGMGLHRLLPLVIIIVIMMLTNLLRTDPAFSIQQTSKYNIERRTSNLGIAYYVKPDFAETFKGSIGNLDAQVEDEYITNLRSSCYKERMYKESLMWQARNYRNSRMYEQAQNTATPSCDTLQEIYGV